MNSITNKLRIRCLLDSQNHSFYSEFIDGIVSSIRSSNHCWKFYTSPLNDQTVSLETVISPLHSESYKSDYLKSPDG